MATYTAQALGAVFIPADVNDYTRLGFAAGGAVPPPPVIAIISPTAAIPGTRGQAANTPIVFQVTDLTPDLQKVLVWVKIVGREETLMIHDGTNFLAPFDSTLSLRTVIANGFQYSVMIKGGWSNGFALNVQAFDSSGNLV